MATNEAESPEDWQAYRIDEGLSVNTQSRVVRARFLPEDRPVLIKILAVDDPTPERRARFRREYEIAARLRVTGIVTPLAFIGDPLALGLVMPDSGSISCDRLLAEGRLGQAQAVAIALAVARTLGEIHGAGIIHKDINPSNIIYRREQEPDTKAVRVIDFGLASELAHEDAEPASPRRLTGTLPYIAPEQTGRLNRSVDYRADFYALGATLHELLTGQPPFAEHDPLALVHRHLAAAPPAPSEIDPTLAEQLDPIVARLLAKTPEARYQTSAAIARDLERCLQALEQGTNIPAFTPGNGDLALKLAVPQTLYGRSATLRELEDAFAHAVAGGRALALVTGAPGVGKSALVQELYTPVTGANAVFVGGKFDQLGAERPYHGLIQAFQQLLQHLLGESEATLEAWRGKLLAALGSNAGVVAQVLPEIEAILGPQPAPPPLDAQGEHNRLTYTLGRFVASIACAETPVLLFLDDLQWADSASMNLLGQFLADPDIGYLTVVGAYRDRDLLADDPADVLTHAVAGTQTDVRSIHLDELGEHDVANIVVDTIGMEHEQCAVLAKLAYDKTLGNPFFLEQLLHRWFREGLLWPDPAEGQWHWDSEAIAESAFADNVVTLMADKIATLPADSQDALARAAVLGGLFDIAELAVVLEQSPPAVLRQLWPALESDLLRPIDEDYKWIGEPGHSGHARFRFLHDKVQQGAAERLTTDERRRAQCGMGRLLMDALNNPEADDRIFEAVGHLNAGREYLTDNSERDQAARLNAIAGRRAVRSGAYRYAYQLYETGLALIANDAWSSTYELALELHNGAAEMAMLVGDIERMRELIDTVIAHARTRADTVTVREFAVKVHMMAADPWTALNEARSALRAFGINVPARPHSAHVLLELFNTRRLLRRHTPEEQLEWAEITDADLRAQMHLMAVAIAPAYITGSFVFPLLVCHQMRLAWQHGNTPSVAYTAPCYGVIVIAQGGAVDWAQRFAGLGRALAERLDAEGYRASMEFVINTFIEPWQNDLTRSTEKLASLVELALQTGDRDYAGYAIVAHSYFKGVSAVDLSAMLADCRRMLDIVRRNGLGWSERISTTLVQPYDILSRRCDTPTQLIGPYADERERFATFNEQADPFGLFALATQKVSLLLHYDAFDEIPQWLPIVRANRFSQQAIPSHFHGLAKDIVGESLYLCRHRNGGTILQRYAINRRLRRLQKEYAAVSYTADLSPWLDYARGAWLRLTGRPMEALAALDRSAHNARERQETELAALALEAAADVAASHNAPELALNYRRAARSTYRQWGAAGKVAFIEARFDLGPPQKPIPTGASSDEEPNTGIHDTPQTLTTASHDFDLEAVARAAQTISRTLRREYLVEKLMRTVAQTAGATHGYLLLFDSDADATAENLRPQARLDIDASEDVTVLSDMPHLAALDRPPAPLQVLRYVLRVGEFVAIDDPADHEPYTRDPYIRLQHPRSILALPLINQGRAAGVLYLEHHQSTGAFSQQRAHVLSLLSTQMAIAIENALLYGSMEEQVAQRTLELEELARTDELTGLSNRRHIMAVLQEEFARSQAEGHPLATLIIDLDYFKTINDRFGHTFGDDVLAHFGDYLKNNVRDQDTPARYGGEEFIVVLPKTDEQAARDIAERLRAHLPAAWSARMPQHSDVLTRLTCSIGVAVTQHDNQETVESLVARGDDNAYRAKAGGRNRVVV